MIRINLLGVERQKTRRSPAFDMGQRVTMACSMILVVAGLGVGWWYWSLTRESARLDTEILAAQAEVARLRTIIAEVTKFEERRKQLEQRVALIEELRKGQSVPVQLLDHVSRSLPDMLWLTALQQTGAEVTVEGRSTTLIAVSDFVGNLATGDFFRKPIEIMDSQVETRSGAATAAGGPDVIRFTVKAQLANAPAGTPAPPAATRR